MKRYFATTCMLASLCTTGCATLASTMRPNEVVVTVTGPKENITTKVQALAVTEPTGQPAYAVDRAGLLTPKQTEPPVSLIHGSSFKLALDRKEDYRLLTESPGYATQQMVISRAHNPWFWGNAVPAVSLIAFGAVAASQPTAYAFLALPYYSVIGLGMSAIGAGVDWFAGTKWEHTPAEVTIDLSKAGGAAAK